MNCVSQIIAIGWNLIEISNISQLMAQIALKCSLVFLNWLKSGDEWMSSDERWWEFQSFGAHKKPFWHFLHFHYRSSNFALFDHLKLFVSFLTAFWVIFCECPFYQFLRNSSTVLVVFSQSESSVRTDSPDCDSLWLILSLLILFHGVFNAPRLSASTAPQVILVPHCEFGR